MADRNQLRTRAHRSCDEARLVVRTQTVGNTPSNLRCLFVELEGTLPDAELIEHIRHATERVCFDDVRTGRVIALVDCLNDIRARLDKQFVAAFEALEVIEGQVRRMNLRPHATVIHEHALGQCLKDRELVPSGKRVESRRH